MAGAQAFSIDPPPRQPIPLDRERGVRTLRWCYRRDGEVLTCALALTSDYSAYELRVSPPYGTPALNAELFDDAISAFERQAAIERALIAQGWVLEQFERSEFIARNA
jgi:hypothetical protein